MADIPPLRTAIAAHRFGLGEANLAVIGSDGAAWVERQIGPAGPPQGSGLVSSLEGIRRLQAYTQERVAVRKSAGQSMSMNEAQELKAANEAFRAVAQADLSSRIVTAVTSDRPFAERLVLFWANHFTVSRAKASVSTLIGAFEREAIRPHIAGSFESLLHAAVTHPAMLRYLDNAQSVGPESRVAAKRLENADRRRALDPAAPKAAIAGLNENLAREILELHTLGAESGRSGSGSYTQADVTAFANVLTGWRVGGPQQLERGEVAYFDAPSHEPGSKRLLGKTYPEGPQALGAVLHDLAQHPATAHFVATKLARHFVADEPPPAVVDRLSAAYLQSGGDLPTVYRSLIAAPEAWAPRLAKLKTPEEFVISSARVTSLGPQVAERTHDGGISLMGQTLHLTPSPAGWPDRAEEWLGPEAVWKRVEWATRISDRLGRQIDARALAQASLGPLLTEGTARQVDRAADGPQALTLLLMAPEFQRR